MPTDVVTPEPTETAPSPNPAQDHSLTQTSPKRAMSLRAKMDQDFAQRGVRTPSTQRTENQRLPGQGEGGDHFPDQDLTKGPKTKAREEAEARAAQDGQRTTDSGDTSVAGGAETPPKRDPRKSGVGGFTEGKPPGLESPPEPETTPEGVKPDGAPSATTTSEGGRGTAASTVQTPDDDIEKIQLGTTNPSQETLTGWKALKGVARDYKTKFEAEAAKSRALEEAAKSGKTLKIGRASCRERV